MALALALVAVRRSWSSWSPSSKLGGQCRSPTSKRSRAATRRAGADLRGWCSSAWSARPTPRCRSTAPSARPPASTAPSPRQGRAPPTRCWTRPSPCASTPTSATCPGPSRAEQTSQTVKIGETKLAFFKVTNHADKPVTGRAVFNVVPEQAGAYFQKLQCFCFSDQTIEPGQTVEMPVLYFVDPKYADGSETKAQAGDHALLHLLPGRQTPQRQAKPRRRRRLHRALANRRGRGYSAHDTQRVAVRRGRTSEGSGTDDGPRRRQARLPPGQSEPLAADRLDRGGGAGAGRRDLDEGPVRPAASTPGGCSSPASPACSTP